jgi:hypothetical protein
MTKRYRFIQRERKREREIERGREREVFHEERR